MPEGVTDSLFHYGAEFPDGPVPVTSEVADRTDHPDRTYASWAADTL